MLRLGRLTPPGRQFRRSGVSTARHAAIAALLVLLVAGAGTTRSAQPRDLLGRATSPQPPSASTQRPAFRAGIDVVSLNVTVTDIGSRYVTDVDRGEFTVFEDGVMQDLTFFNRVNLPIALALLLDTSASMEEKLATAQEAAIGFARRLRPQDVATIIDFDSRVEVLQPFTNQSEKLEQAVRRTAAGGSTSLYNAIYISLKELKKEQARTSNEIRRQAIVVLSDGEDTSSLVTFEEVMDLAKRSETAIYTIALRSRELGTSKGFKEAEFVMRHLAQETGGRAFFPSRIEDLASAYAQIADEIASQYTLGYISKNARRDGAWRRIVVRVNRPNVTTRTKQGYYAPTDAVATFDFDEGRLDPFRVPGFGFKLATRFDLRPSTFDFRPSTLP